MQNAECRMENAECRIKNAEFRMQNAKCRIKNAEFGGGEGRGLAEGDVEFVGDSFDVGFEEYSESNQKEENSEVR